MSPLLSLSLWIPAYEVSGLSFQRELNIDKIRIKLTIKDEPYVVPSWSCVGFFFLGRKNVLMNPGAHHPPCLIFLSTGYSTVATRTPKRAWNRSGTIESTAAAVP